jgi:hypothetical protein
MVSAELRQPALQQVLLVLEVAQRELRRLVDLTDGLLISTVDFGTRSDGRRLDSRRDERPFAARAASSDVGVSSGSAGAEGGGSSITSPN